MSRAHPDRAPPPGNDHTMATRGVGLIQPRSRPPVPRARLPLSAHLFEDVRTTLLWAHRLPSPVIIEPQKTDFMVYSSWMGLERGLIAVCFSRMPARVILDHEMAIRENSRCLGWRSGTTCQTVRLLAATDGAKTSAHHWVALLQINMSAKRS